MGSYCTIWVGGDRLRLWSIPCRQVQAAPKNGVFPFSPPFNQNPLRGWIALDGLNRPRAMTGHQRSTAPQGTEGQTMTHSTRMMTRMMAGLKGSAAGLGCLTMFGLASTANAATTGFEFVTSSVNQGDWLVSDPRTLVSVQVYITFDDDADRLIIVNGKPGDNISISTNDASGFFQSANGSTNDSKTRLTTVIDAFPSAQADSYVSIGLLNNDSGTDAIITTGMDWATFNAGGSLQALDNAQGGGWLVTPDDDQGDATDGRVFIGQFTVESGATITGTLNYMYVDDAVNVEADGETFETTADLETSTAKSDFNGDGQSDLLWMGDYGVDGAGIWEGSLLSWINWDGTDGGYDSNFVYNGVDTGSPVPEEWVVAGTGDMNSDGRADIVWRDPDGAIIVWFMDADGYNYTSQWLYNGAIAGWSIRGIGDFNGDGQADILWMGDYGAEGAGAYNGSLISWLNWDGTDGGYDSDFVYNGVATGTPVPEDWVVVGTGDMNANGRDDIIWRDPDGSVIVWFMDADGHNYTSQWLYNDVIAGWSIVALGDFNGDDQCDILWMGDYGVDGAGIWEGSLLSWVDWDGTDGGYDSDFVYNGVATGTPVPEEWVVVSSGDMNANGRDDIIWRDPDGAVIVWFMDADGHNYTSQWLYNGEILGWSIKSPRDIFND